MSNIKKFDLIDTVIPVIDNSVEASKRIEDDLGLVFMMEVTPLSQQEMIIFMER